MAGVQPSNLTLLEGEVCRNSHFYASFCLMLAFCNPIGLYFLNLGNCFEEHSVTFCLQKNLSTSLRNAKKYCIQFSAKSTSPA